MKGKHRPACRHYMSVNTTSLGAGLGLGQLI